MYETDVKDMCTFTYIRKHPKPYCIYILQHILSISQTYAYIKAIFILHLLIIICYFILLFKKKLE